MPKNVDAAKIRVLFVGSTLNGKMCRVRVEDADHLKVNLSPEQVQALPEFVDCEFKDPNYCAWKVEPMGRSEERLLWTVPKRMEVFLGGVGKKGALERLPPTGRREQDGGRKTGAARCGREGGGRDAVRLKGFDYRRPFFYMVTLKRLPGLADFSRITDAAEPPLESQGKPCHLVANAITRAFERTIRHFHEQWWGLWPLECFAIMPDHIHLLFRLRDSGDQLPLGKYVYHLMKALAEDYWRVTGSMPQGSEGRQTGLPPQNAPVSSGAPPAPVFEKKWHDWIVKKEGQLAAFRRYIEENPARSWLRRQNARYFGTVRTVSFCGREWFAYGNAAILDLPVLAAVRGHRATQPGSPEWDGLVGTCARLGPGGAGVGTFMSPLEKACGNAIAKAGGKWVVLSPEGFPPRWHPHRQQERFCAEGRMLFLSLYEATEHRLSNKDLHHRCHEMGDIVVAGLGEPPTGRRTQDGGRQAECGGGVRERAKKWGGRRIGIDRGGGGG